MLSNADMLHFSNEVWNEKKFAEFSLKSCHDFRFARISLKSCHDFRFANFNIMLVGRHPHFVTEQHITAFLVGCLTAVRNHPPHKLNILRLVKE